MRILGISAYYHDSSAVLLEDETIAAAAQEERFTRKKQDSSFPDKAVSFCLEHTGLKLRDIDYIAFYDKPFLKFERILLSYLSIAPAGFSSFVMSMPIWLKDKLFLKKTILDELKKLGGDEQDIRVKLLFSEHHESHAASAFFPSPFQEAAVLTVDGVGEWTTTCIAHGRNSELQFLEEMHFPHSLGLLYSAFTYFLGFKVNSGEYKVMGLAPYGKPRYAQLFYDHLLDLKGDGSFRLNLKYFNFVSGLTMTSRQMEILFGKARRQPESLLDQDYMDIAASLQAVTEEIMLRLARYAAKLTSSGNLCLAGGVALNCVANGRILREKIFESIWIQPASGDAGGALGAAYAALYRHTGAPRTMPAGSQDKMKGSYLGPASTRKEITAYFSRMGAKTQEYEDDEALLDRVAQMISEGKIIGWHSGRMEYGPRALGGRSILGDPRDKTMQRRMNLKIKFRESFRPFAPSVLASEAGRYFVIDTISPYMLLTAPVRQEHRIAMTGDEEKLFGIDKLNIPRSVIPAVTHIDYSSRIQTIHPETSPRYHRLLEKFCALTGCGLVVNTSFNVRGEPIVCTVEDSYKCFMRTEIDALVVENFLLLKEEQPLFNDKENWLKKYELD